MFEHRHVWAGLIALVLASSVGAQDLVFKKESDYVSPFDKAPVKVPVDDERPRSTPVPAHSASVAEKPATEAPRRAAPSPAAQAPSTPTPAASSSVEKVVSEAPKRVAPASAPSPSVAPSTPTIADAPKKPAVVPAQATLSTSAAEKPAAQPTPVEAAKKVTSTPSMSAPAPSTAPAIANTQPPLVLPPNSRFSTYTPPAPDPLADAPATGRRDKEPKAVRVPLPPGWDQPKAAATPSASRSSRSSQAVKNVEPKMDNADAAPAITNESVKPATSSYLAKPNGFVAATPPPQVPSALMPPAPIVAKPTTTPAPTASEPSVAGVAPVLASNAAAKPLPPAGTPMVVAPEDAPASTPTVATSQTEVSAAEPSNETSALGAFLVKLAWGLGLVAAFFGGAGWMWYRNRQKDPALTKNWFEMTT